MELALAIDREFIKHFSHEELARTWMVTLRESIAALVRAHLGEEREQQDWLIAKIRALKNYHPPTDDRPVWQEIQGWMHMLCFHRDQWDGYLKELETLRAQAAAHAEGVRKIQVRMVRLQQALRSLLAVHMGCVPEAGGCDYCRPARALLAETDGR